jgi:hypothetical protein
VVLLEKVIHHSGGDIDPGGVDAVAKFHGVVDLNDGQSVRGFEQVYGKQTTTDDLRNPLAQISDFRREGYSQTLL